MARPLKPLVRGGGFYPSKKWTPLVYAGGYTTANGGEEPAPPPIEKTVIGNPIHITDALAKPVQALSISLEPIQDLNGYDNPWPAGGGKNLYNANALNNLSNSGITVTVSNGTITLNGTATANAFFSVRSTGLPSGNYVFTFNNPVASSGVHVSFQNSGKQYFSDTRANAVNKSAAFTGEPTNILLYVDSGTTLTDFVVKPQLETGSTSTSWTPYSNICPISGFTSVEVWDDPKYGGTICWNQLIQNGNFADDAHWFGNGAAFTVSGGAASVTPTQKWGKMQEDANSGRNVIAGHRYLAIAEVIGDTHTYIEFGAVIAKYLSHESSTWQQIAAIGTASAAGYARFGIGTNATDNFKTISVRNAHVHDLTQMFGAGNEPSTVEEFEALFPHDYYDYNAGTQTTVGAVNGEEGTHLTADFSAYGTQYGGYVDLVTGEVWADRVGFVSTKDALNGLEEKTSTSTVDWLVVRCASAFPNTDGNKRVQSICTHAKYKFANVDGTTHYYITTNGFWMAVPKTTYPTFTDFANSLTGDDILTCVAYVAPYLVGTLTAQSLTLLQGENNLWSNANGNLDLTYLADGNASEIEALNILLGNRYYNNHEADEPTDREALDILLGGNTR